MIFTDNELDILAKVYTYILSWPDNEPTVPPDSVVGQGEPAIDGTVEEDNAPASLTRTSAVMNSEISKLATKAEDSNDG